MTRNFMDLLGAQWVDNKFVCVGLDSKEAELPIINGERISQHGFNCEIINATMDTAACYKPNLAFYPGSEGKERLKATIAYGHEVAPHIPWIVDFKKADIGNTNIGYVEEAFEYFGADACTVHNYMGMPAMKPFLDRKEKGIIVLCKTSNPGSGEFQNLEVRVSQRMLDEVNGGTVCDFDNRDQVAIDAMPLYQWVARRVASPYGWNYNGNCGLVAGATYPEELAKIREAAPNAFILCPGIGKQGGDLAATVAAARDARGRGFLINSSSGIIFASQDKEFAGSARCETLKLDLSIRKELMALA